MLYALAFMVSGIAWYHRNQRNELLFLDYRYRFFALRDKLREKAITGEIDPEHWLFDYLDSSICGVVDSLNRINVYSTLSLFLFHRKDPAFIELRKRVSEGLAGEFGLTEIDDEFGYLLGQFMEKRHKVFFYVLKIGLFSAITPFVVYQVVKNTLEESTLELKLYPETSTCVA